MNKLQKTEHIIVAILWITCIGNYIYTVLDGESLYFFDYFALPALAVTTVFVFNKPDKAFEILLMLLVPGLFGAFSFIYFFDFYIMLNYVEFQIVPSIILIVLITKRKDKVRELYDATLGKVGEEKKTSQPDLKAHFLTEFENLTDEEIEIRLQKNLAYEAREALLEIKKGRSKYTS